MSDNQSSSDNRSLLDDRATREHMSLAIRLAALGRFTTSPNPNVGCVIVKDEEVIGAGWHIRAGGPHAEVHALRQAGNKARGATVYVTLEPCSHHGRTPPCCEALIDAGVAKVVIAMGDPNPQVSGRGIARMQEAGIEVEVGVMADQAALLNPGFIRRMSAGRPRVTSKIAISLDGRTAMASGESQWITGPDARRDVQKLRARCSAIITGAGTVLSDDCALTVRPDDWSDPYLPAEIEDRIVRQPLRVVLLGKDPISVSAKIFQSEAQTLAVGVEPRPDWLPEQVDFLQLPALDGRVDLDALLIELAKQEINDVLIEAGAELNGAFLRAGLVDELYIYMAPKLLGSTGRPLAALPLAQMNEELPLDILDIRQIGKDIRIHAALD